MNPKDLSIYKLQLVTVSKSLTRLKFTGSESIARVLRRYIGSEDRENFVVLLLDNDNRFIGMATLSIGTSNRTLVEPKHIFAAAVSRNASAILLAHNHPSGNPLPTESDYELTNTLVQASKVMKIPILDHIIVALGTKRYFSFADSTEILKSTLVLWGFLFLSSLSSVIGLVVSSN